MSNSNHGQDMQSRSSQPDPTTVTESETYQTLLTRAHRRTGGVPAESIVRHVLSVTRGGDWPVQRSARGGTSPLRIGPRRRDSDRRAASWEDDGAEREIEAVVAAGDESRDVAIPTATAPEPSDRAATIQQLFAGLTIQRTGSGGLVIEAPPESASALAALFSGMAQLLQAAAAPQIAGGGSVGQ